MYLKCAQQDRWVVCMCECVWFKIGTKLKLIKFFDIHGTSLPFLTWNSSCINTFSLSLALLALLAFALYYFHDTYHFWVLYLLNFDKMENFKIYFGKGFCLEWHTHLKYFLFKGDRRLHGKFWVDIKFLFLNCLCGNTLANLWDSGKSFGTT